MSQYSRYPTIGAGSWKAPVATPSDLPLTGNVDGDARITQSTDSLYVWGGSSWMLVASPSGSGMAITALSGDVSANGPGAVAATVNSVGGKSAADVATSVSDTQAATALNTASTIVKRNGSGNFAAGTITAALTGTASGNLVSINSDTTQAQVIAAASTGTDFTVATVAGTTTLAIPSASAVNRGLLTSADFSTFSAKQSTVTIGALDAQAANATGLALVSNVLSTQSADATHPGVVNTTTQSFAGNKTFTGTIGASNLSGTNTGDVTLGAVGSSPNANAASLSGQVLTLQPADATNPGVLTTGSQAIAGAKTFSSVVNANAGIDRSTSGTLTIGATNSTIINIGNAGATVNIQGTTIYENTPQLIVADPLITLNSGGGAGSGQNAGIQIEENALITGYAETSSDRNSWILKAPNTAGIATITAGVSGITLDQSSHNPVTIGTANGLSLSTQVLSLAAASTSTTGALTSTDWNTFNGKQAAGSYITALTGDVTAAGPGSSAATLATVNSNVGSFTNSSITVNAKGLITAASSGAAAPSAGTAVGIPTNTTSDGVSSNFARADHIHRLTSGAATTDQLPQFDGSNWIATNPEQILAPSKAIRLYDDFVTSDNSNMASSNRIGELRWNIGTQADRSSVPLTNLQVWFRADAGVTQTFGLVSAWADQSGNARNAAQATGTNQPLYVENAVNGKPAISFDGVDNFLTFTYAISGLTGMTVFMVSNCTTDKTSFTSGAEYAALFWNESASWGATYLSPFQTTLRARFGTVQTSNNPVYTRAATIGTAWSVSSARHLSTTDNLYVSGTSVLAEAGKSTTLANVNSTGNIGRGYNDNTYFPGTIAEILVYSTGLSDSDMDKVEAYLTAKYFSTTPITSTIAENTAKVDTNHPGVIKVTAGSNPEDYALASIPPSIKLAGGVLTYEALVQVETLSTVSNEYTVRIGLGDTTNSSDNTNGVYFEYTRTTSANWLIKTSSASSQTSTTTSTAVSAGSWVTLSIVINAAASSITFSINGSSVGTITTNIPTAALGMIFQQIRTAGTPVGFDVDYVRAYQRFTSSR